MGVSSQFIVNRSCGLVAHYYHRQNNLSFLLHIWHFLVRLVYCQLWPNYKKVQQGFETRLRRSLEMLSLAWCTQLFLPAMLHGAIIVFTDPIRIFSIIVFLAPFSVRPSIFNRLMFLRKSSLYKFVNFIIQSFWVYSKSKCNVHRLIKSILWIVNNIVSYIKKIIMVKFTSESTSENIVTHHQHNQKDHLNISRSLNYY